MSSVNRHRRGEVVLAAASGAASMAAYAITVAPSIPLWDCGEFIACAYTLGVSHPPGAPLFTLIGRVFSMLPFASVPVMVNWVSVLSSATTVAVVSVLISRLVTRAAGGEGGSSPWAGYLAGWAGALCVAFSRTYWFNATEAEVYGLSSLLMMVGVWLVMRWDDLRYADPGAASRRLVLAAYVAFLGPAVHMTVYLFAIPAFLFVVISDRRYLRDVRFWAVAVGLSTFVVTIDIFLVAASALLVVSVFRAFTAKGEARVKWGLYAALVVVAVIGYSSQAYVPVRSTRDPGIDQNDPETWTNWEMFLERKQYGQESMLSSMFHRRGSWGNQLGAHPRLGLFGFFREQYAPARAWALPTAVGIVGFVWGLLRARRRTLLILMLTVLCTVGLVVYINMSDGTRGAILEVRDRDYIFSPGFLAFGLAIGLGVGALVAPLFRKSDGRFVSGIAMRAAATAFAVLLPALPFASHFSTSDRRGDYVAYEFAHNVLASCRPNAMLFTNGDNDTFPLWCIQQVDSFRTDVRVVNLSLLQLDWYIMQLKHQHGVPMFLSDEQIVTVDTVIRGEHMRIPREWYSDPLDAESPMKLLVPWPTRNDRVMLVSHQMIRQIVAANRWQSPVHFSVTCGNTHQEDDLILLPLSRHARREGLVYNIVPDSTGPFDVDVGRTAALVLDTFFTRSLPRYWVDGSQAARSLLVTYMTAAAAGAAQAERQGDASTALELLSWIVTRYPDDARVSSGLIELAARIGDTPVSRAALWSALGDREIAPRAAALLSRFVANAGALDATIDSLAGSSAIEDALVRAACLAQAGRRDEAFGLLSELVARHPKDPRPAVLTAGLRVEAADTQGAIVALRELLGRNDESREATYGLMTLLVSTGRGEEGRLLADDWLNRHPGDFDFMRFSRPGAVR